MEVRSSGLLSMMIDFSMYAYIPNGAVLLEEAVGLLTHRWCFKEVMHFYSCGDTRPPYTENLHLKSLPEGRRPAQQLQQFLLFFQPQ